CWRWGGDCWRLWWCWHWRDGCWRICRRSGWLRGTALLNPQRHHASERNGRTNPMHTLKLSMALLLRRVCSCACFVQEAVAAPAGLGVTLGMGVAVGFGVVVGVGVGVAPCSGL